MHFAYAVLGMQTNYDKQFLLLKLIRMHLAYF